MFGRDLDLANFRAEHLQFINVTRQPFGPELFSEHMGAVCQLLYHRICMHTWRLNQNLRDDIPQTEYCAFELEESFFNMK
ncbi:MAG: hypothetical protein DI555_23105 [Novosphingobium pentaromativorans]|uniref:Uncharacterized protein n=1 Tax=Novosphingobium pentaromativorans TaxID=205844 RepID=A0A2W5NHM2_9SPHN|nr:MAG: hypothetical protein DI555_23105 [Novosphingobium pentaromativorans]